MGARMLAMGLAALAAAGCGAPSFACRDAQQCSLVANGVCQPDGYCSYPDGACPSGQRFSEHAGSLAGQCVEPGAGSSSGPEPTPTSTTDAPEDPCLQVDCGPNGVCEPRGELPACACDPGYVDVGVQCVEQGCPGTSCLWVDALEGDDANSGRTRAAPIRSLARAAALAPALAAGEALVLRRGRVWDEPLALTGLLGEESPPIVVAPYGPDDEANPRIGGGLSLEDSVGVEVRDLSVTHAGGVGLRLSGASHATVLRCEVFESSGGCIRVEGTSDHTAVVASSAWSCGTATFGIALLGAQLGDHHWLLDNRIDGEGTTNALHVTVTTADDVKVVRNYLRGSVDRGLHSRVGTHGWLVGNVIAQAGDANDAGFDHAGGGVVLARGNVVLDAALPVVLAGGGEWAFNTVLHAAAAPALTVPAMATTWSVHHGLVLAGNGPVLAVADASAVQTERNVYAPGPAGQCTIDAEGMLVDLAGWQTGFDQDPLSRCEPVPGPSVPAQIGSTRDWDAAGLLEAVVPDADWSGCADPVGAYDCDGEPLAAGLPAFDDIGHGWPGPPVVQERVELVR